MSLTTTDTPNTSTKQARQSSLADAIFTSTQQRVLAPLFGQPGKSFFVTQIMELANSGRGAVQRELERLRAGGLVNVTMMGTQKHYQANPASPLFDELCGIVRKTFGLEEPLREAVTALSAPIRLAAIYGSVAKGLETSSSDVDILIVSDELTLEEVYSVMDSVESSLSRQVNPTLYTNAEFERKRTKTSSFLAKVLSGPLIVLAGAIDAA